MKMSETEAQQLMLDAQAGNTQAFGRLYAEFFTPVFRYLVARTRNREESEDIAQTVFVKVLHSIGRFKNQGVPPLAYFFTVARNALIDHWKLKKSIAVDAEELERQAPSVDYASGIADGIDRSEKRRHIESALEKLRDDQREVLALKYFGELSTSEISAHLGKTEVAVRQIQCRALKALKEHLPYDKR